MQQGQARAARIREIFKLRKTYFRVAKVTPMKRNLTQLRIVHMSYDWNKRRFDRSVFKKPIIS